MKQIERLSQRPREVVEYRKSGFSLNQLQQLDAQVLWDGRIPHE